MQNKKTSS